MNRTVTVADALGRSYLFEGLTRADLEPLATVVRVQHLTRGEHVWHIGDDSNEICVVAAGEVKDAVLDIDGNEIVHFVHGPGMTFGEPGFFAVDRQRLVAVIATEPTVLIRMPREHLTPFIEQHPSIKDRALEGLASNTRWQSTLIASMARRSLIDRVGLRLLELVDSSAEPAAGARGTPRVSQSTLANMVGVSRENVNRALAVLVAEGFVRLANGRYVLVDETGLRERIARDWPLAGRRDRRV